MPPQVPQRQFPMEQYLQAMQQKYQNDQNTPQNQLGAAMGQGITTGVNAGLTSKMNREKGQNDTINAMVSKLMESHSFAKKDGSDMTPGDELTATSMIVRGQPLTDSPYTIVGKKEKPAYSQGADGKLTPAVTTDNQPVYSGSDIIKPPTANTPFSLNNNFTLPDNMEISGYDQKGNPMIRLKVDPNAAAAAKATATEDMTYGRETAKNKAKAQKEYIDIKTTAPQMLKNVNEVLETNKNTYSGVVGDWQYKLASATNSNDPKFKNTTEVINRMQNMVAQMLKATFGGQLSDSEREYLNKVYGALPKMSQTEREVAMNNVINTIQNKLESKANAYKEYGGQIDNTSTGTNPIAEKQPAQPKPNITDDPMGLFK